MSESDKAGWTDILDVFKDHLKNLKDSGKPYCNYCFDDRNIKELDDKWWCEDCLYMQSLLKDIKKISSSDI